MLQTLNTLAGKISPNTPNPGAGGTDSNANKVIHLNNNTHPYNKTMAIAASNGSSEK